MSAQFTDRKIYPTSVRDYLKMFKLSDEEISKIFSRTINSLSPDTASVITLPPEEELSDSCPNILMLPAGKDKNNNRHKTIVECCINLMVRVITERLRDKGDRCIENYELSSEVICKLHNIARFLGFLINCKSWQDQKFHDFDIDELNRRLEFLKL